MKGKEEDKGEDEDKDKDEGKDGDKGKKLKELISDEANIMKKLKHEHIIKLIKFYDKTSYMPNPADKKLYQVSALAMELAKNGQVFDFILSTGRFTEEVARYYFHQLIEAVKYIHEEGIVHRDIKLENCVFDDNFKLKVIDFGFSSMESLSKSKTGTTRYLPPEAHAGKPYDGMKADLFACGVCLFMMVARKNPFNKAAKKDENIKEDVGNLGYAPFIDEEPEKFWTNQLKQMGEEDGFFSKEFKELVNGLLNPNSKKRWDIDDVKESDWMKEDVMRDQKVLDEMKERKSTFNNPKQKEIPDRADESVMKSIFFQGGTNRGLEDNDYDDQDYLTYRICDKFIPWYRIYTSIFSTEDIDYLWGILVTSCSQMANELNFAEGKYGVEMTIKEDESEDDEETKGENSIKISASILEVSEGIYCVEFSPIKGDRFKFQEIYEDIKDYFGGLANVESREIEEFYQAEKV